MRKPFRILFSSKTFGGAYTENSKNHSILKFVVENYYETRFDFKKNFPHFHPQYLSIYQSLKKLIYHVENLVDEIIKKSLETQTPINLLIKENTEWSSVLFKINKGISVEDYFLKSISIENLYTFLLKFL